MRFLGFAESLIGSIRQECLDHIVLFGICHRKNPPAHQPKGQRCCIARFNSAWRPVNAKGIAVSRSNSQTPARRIHQT